MLEKFLRYIKFEKRFSPHTITSYEKDLNQFITFITDKYDLTSETLSEVRHFHVRSWVIALLGKDAEYELSPISTRSINRKLSSLNAIFKFLQKQEVIKNNPLDQVIAPKTEKKVINFINEKDLTNLLQQIDWTDSYKDQRDRMLIETLYNTGIRRAELMNLKVEDINIEGSYIKVLGKRNKERIVPFSQSFKTLIQQYLVVRNTTFPQTVNPYFFLTEKGKQLYPKAIYLIANKYLSLIPTLEQRSPHVFRHTFATHLNNNGADLNAIKSLLGHSSLASTEVYTHSSIERLKAVYANAHPNANKR